MPPVLGARYLDRQVPDGESLGTSGPVQPTGPYHPSFRDRQIQLFHTWHDALLSRPVNPSTETGTGLLQRTLRSLNVRNIHHMSLEASKRWGRQRMQGGLTVREPYKSALEDDEPACNGSRRILMNTDGITYETHR